MIRRVESGKHPRTLPSSHPVPMPAQFRLYIVRHGETDWNRMRRIQGQLDVPLNETGLEQAMLVAEALRGIPFVKAFSSDLQRASMVVRSPIPRDPQLIYLFL